MAMTNNPALAKTMRMLRSHGITREPEDFINESDGPWYYEQQMLGFNYRMTDIQAALGLSQMANLDEFLDKRRAIAARYQAKLPELSIEVLANRDDRLSAWHLFVIKISAEKRKTLFEQLRATDIGVNVHYIPIFSQPYYQPESGARVGASRDFYQTIISIPSYPMLSADLQGNVIQSLSPWLNPL